ncbi:hypothetical protein U1Q18_008039 [Sarracenia purpurea var. burkii]
MGRGRVHLRRIEDKNKRQVTFSKRRRGLMKKAQELSVLCDADLALVVLTSHGRFYEFSSGNKYSLFPLSFLLSNPSVYSIFLFLYRSLGVVHQSYRCIFCGVRTTLLACRTILKECCDRFSTLCARRRFYIQIH